MDHHKTNRKRPNNERVSASEIKLFICFICGEQYTNAPEYQRHLLIPHQAFALCYQMYNSQMKSKRKSRSVGETKKTVEKVPKTEKLQKTSSHREEETKRKSSLTAKMSTESAPARVSHAENSPRISSSDNSSASSPSVQNRSHTGNVCRICALRFPKFSSLVRHLVSNHHVTISNIFMHLFKGNDHLVRKTSPAGSECPPCSLRFVNKTEYYEHLLAKHVPDIFFTLLEKYTTIDSVKPEVFFKSQQGEEFVETFKMHISEMT
ncbi:unnamed protein product [Caenorhabditis auriculariae]|uniref:C2H2-type domain-containing protein n=1 Tax=Caenorhabditis auriculariae TaxID=2777116 RepID=A0A8S1H053_9PELO|nr:unnamed protein product [Caenorhabditis auriculariae]